MERYVKEAAEVAFLLLIATVTYDLLSANCFHKTHTYRCFKSIRNSKACKRFLKRFKKRRRCCRCSIWSVYNPPLWNAEVVNQISLPFAKFGSAWPELKSNVLRLVQEIVTCMEKKLPSLQLLTSILVQNFMKLAGDSVKKFSHHIKTYTQTVANCTTKVVRHYQH